MLNNVSPIRRSLVALLAALALFAAACGDDGGVAATPEGGDTDQPDDSSGDDTSGDDADQPDVDSSGDDTSGDDTDGEDDAADDTDGDASDNENDTGDASSYCALAAEQYAIDGEFGFISATPEEIEAYFTDNRNALAQAVAIAPPEIRADLKTVLTAFENQFLPVLTAAGWDILAAADDLEAINDNPVLEEASDRVEAYDAEACGLEDESADVPTLDPGLGEGSEFLETLLSSEFGRQAFIEGLSEDGTVTAEQAGCLIDNLDIGLLAALGAGGAGEDAFGEMLGAFDACGISPDQFS